MRRVDPRQVHRAHLVLHNLVHPGPVPEPGENQGDRKDGYPQLLDQPPPHRVRHRLARLGVPAAAVRPHTGEHALGLGAPGEQELPGLVEDVAGKGQVQRRLVMMHADLVRGAQGPSVLIQENYFFHNRANYQAGHIKSERRRRHL